LAGNSIGIDRFILREENMAQDITTICLPMPFKFGSVNCYLIKTEAGFILIDSGAPTMRSDLVKALERAGCQPGNLHLIVITHGDFDHTGNAAYLREKYAAKIAIHPDDAGMAEQADMFWNRKNANRLIGRLLPVIIHFTKSDRFTADVLVSDGEDLSEYGWCAQVLEIPGHSKGSVAILSPDGDLFCGDLMMNDRTDPYLGFGDPADFRSSIEKVKSLKINQIYPGHGLPFSKDRIP